jgi:sugar lactone lactonase YvrE
MLSLFLDAAATLGESPRWSARDHCLYWVDIDAKRIHRSQIGPDPAQCAGDEFIEFPEQVGCIALCRSGGLIIALENGLRHMPSWGAETVPFSDAILADKPHQRFNDGCVDPQGRLWVGAVTSDKAHPDASLYRIDPTGHATEMLTGLTTSNGAGFSPNGDIFYHADTPSHAIRLFAFDGDAGTLGRPALFHQFPFGEGRPDGCAVDEAGYYWSALFDGGRVVRLSPAGEIVQTVILPTARPTMIALGGPDRKTAYVTTASKGLDAEARAQQPHAGGIFTFRVDVAGLAPALFAL